jgi:hypothetical protein
MTRFLFTQEPSLIVLSPIVVGESEIRQPLFFISTWVAGPVANRATGMGNPIPELAKE